ncbi:MAG: exodeoxyribonuclease VII small subunit [Pseudohongiellaceae bacterium]
MPPKKTTSFNFETAMEELEELVTTMEDGELSLEESLAAFEKGVKLTRECQAALKKAEQKVQVLLNDSGKTEAMTLPDDEQASE